MTEAYERETVFSSLYERYSPVIYRLAFRWLGNHEEASDLTNSAFLKLHKAMAAGEVIENPKTWIYSVAANLCRDSLRRTVKYRNILRENYQDKSQMQIAPAGNRDQEIAQIRSAMARLPERDRILLLLYQDELSYAEMAKATGIKMTSIGKTLSRAIARLANAFKNGDVR